MATYCIPHACVCRILASEIGVWLLLWNDISHMKAVLLVVIGRKVEHLIPKMFQIQDMFQDVWLLKHNRMSCVVSDSSHSPDSVCVCLHVCNRGQQLGATSRVPDQWSPPAPNTGYHSYSNYNPPLVAFLSTFPKLRAAFSESGH